MMQLEIYPEMWDATGSDAKTELGYLLESCEELRQFVTETADAGDGAIAFLT